MAHTRGNPVIVEGGPSQAPPGVDIAKDYDTFLLNVNGNGRMAVLFNRMEPVYKSYIGMGSNDGKFDFSHVNQNHPVCHQWAQFKILAGDVNGDSREDIIYVNANATNRVYVGIARGSVQ